MGKGMIAVELVSSAAKKNSAEKEKRDKKRTALYVLQNYYNS